MSDILFKDVWSPVLLVATPPCPDYSTSNRNPQDVSGDKGGAELLKMRGIVKRVKPLVVLNFGGSGES